ncbi:hypothetical protein PMSD_03460 [Paenibacillus macquariensis subsp. defensor]|nr:hypothetical protein PMSD_03460 [Paenibacillus macquariensis subsp. defensor]
MCDCHRCRKHRCLKRKARKLKKEIKVLNKLLSKITINVKVVNNPKNINKNKLVNFDPDYTGANAGGGGGGGGGNNGVVTVTP